MNGVGSHSEKRRGNEKERYSKGSIFGPKGSETEHVVLLDAPFA
jgi:hypothetical protein